jgi:hypothetical protein
MGTMFQVLSVLGSARGVLPSSEFSSKFVWSELDSTLQFFVLTEQQTKIKNLRLTVLLGLCPMPWSTIKFARLFSLLKFMPSLEPQDLTKISLENRALDLFCGA